MIEKQNKPGQTAQQQGASGMGAMFYENIISVINKGNSEVLNAIRNLPAPNVTVPPPKVEVHGLGKKDLEMVFRDTMAGQDAKLDEISTTLNAMKSAQDSVPYVERVAKFIFTKRALVLFAVVVITAVAFGNLCYDNHVKSDRLARIEMSDLKYRYVRAVGYASPRMLGHLDSICAEGRSEDMEAMYNRVKTYERQVREKSDSIVHAEQQKKARL